MADQVLMREDAPLSSEQWSLVDQMVSKVANRILVGRRLLDLYGPLGFGAYTVPLYTYGGDDAVRAKIAKQLPLVTLTQDFAISVKDLELMNGGQPFDTAPVAAAAARSARAEDNLIFNGDKKEGVEGLLSVKGHSTLKLSDWESEGGALQDVAAATAHLTAQQFYGPYFVVVHPMRHAKLQRVYGRRGVLEINLLEKQASGGVFASPVMPEDKVLVVTAQPQYMDLAVGLDLSVAFVETANMEHLFRLIETVALRIKQPDAICVLE